MKRLNPRLSHVSEISKTEDKTWYPNSTFHPLDYSPLPIPSHHKGSWETNCFISSYLSSQKLQRDSVKRQVSHQKSKSWQRLLQLFLIHFIYKLHPASESTTTHWHDQVCSNGLLLQKLLAALCLRGAKPDRTFIYDPEHLQQSVQAISKAE